jgi:hypothetical protein
MSDPQPPKPVVQLTGKKRGRVGHPKEIREGAIALMRAGKTYDAVSAETGISRTTLVTWRRNAGLPPRPLGPRPMQPRNWKTPAELQGKVAALRAEGLSVKDIGRALHVDWHRVSGIVKQPSTQVEILRRRELVKSLSAEALPVITAKAYGLAEDAIDNQDAKSFDAAMRGLHAAERIAASVSGEDRKVQVEHSGSVETTTPAVPVIEQLNVLIAAVRGHSA